MEPNLDNLVNGICGCCNGSADENDLDILFNGWRGPILELIRKGLVMIRDGRYFATENAWQRYASLSA